MRYSREMMPHIGVVQRPTFLTVALLAIGFLLTTSCTTSDEVVFDGATPDQADTSTTGVPTTLSPVTSPQAETATTPAASSGTTVVVTRAAETATTSTPSTLAVSEQHIDSLTGQVAINGPLTESVTILGPGTARLELFAAVGEFITQPTWSPDGRFVAWSRTSPEGYSVVVSSTGSGLGTPYETPFSVFYMQWAADGRTLGLLGSPEPGRVALAILDLDSETVTSMNTSSSYYFHWSPDGNEMITHLDRARLELFNPMTGDTSPLDTLQLVRSDFQAAAWTPDGRSILYVRPGIRGQEESPDELVIHNLDTGEIDVLGEGAGFFNFAVSPDGKSVAYSIQGVGVVTSMQVVDLATGRSEQVDAPRTVAWQWSPDSHKILLLGLGTNGMTVEVYEAGNITSYQEIIPTDTFLRSYLVFWGQYDLSHSLWAPDSSAFVYAAYDRDSNLVFLQLLDEELPILLGPGAMAAFAPAPAR